MLPTGPIGLPLTKLTPKEVELVGSFRFHDEFGVAVEALVGAWLDAAPILTGTSRPAALGRKHRMKVQLVFEDR
jgi:L-idonate 5-dehydrogenase